MPETKRCCEVGTIFYTSWGYEQTNVDFYEVIHSTAKMVTVRELEKATAEDNGQFTGRAVPYRYRASTGRTASPSSASWIQTTLENP